MIWVRSQILQTMGCIIWARDPDQQRRQMIWVRSQTLQTMGCKIWAGGKINGGSRSIWVRSQILQEFLSLNVLNPVVTSRLIDYGFLGINSHTTNCLQRCNDGQEYILQNLKTNFSTIFSSHSIQSERERERNREGTSGAHTAAAPNNTQNQNPAPRRLLTFFSLPKLSDCCSFLCCSRFLSLRHHIAAY